MPSNLEIRLHRPLLPPLSRAVFSPPVLLVLVAVLACFATPSLAANENQGESIHEFQLMPGWTGLVGTDGGLVIQGNEGRSALLRAELLPRQDSRRRRNGDLFHAIVTEGAPGGHRGFSARADDDGDGRIDEDPLDGLDNDGDGRIDEDYAAIGDAMASIQLRSRGGSDRTTHLEYYHWDHSHLASAVFLNVGGGATAGPKQSYSLRSDGADWLETETSSILHTVSGDLRREGLHAFVCRVDLARNPIVDPCSPGAYRWLGVMILDGDPANRFFRDGDRIELPLGEKAIPLVVCVADSWLQLNRILGEAQQVFEGVTDPVDSRTTPWIVPAVCSTCRAAAAPAFDLTTDPSGAVTLSAAVQSGQCGLLDPDLFSIGGQPLGAPREIRWRSDGGMEKVIPWRCLTTEYLQDNGPATPFSLFADLMDHDARGRLAFIFSPTGASPAMGKLTGRYLDSRLLEAELVEDVPRETEVRIPVGESVSLDPEPEAVEETARGYAEDRARLLEQERGRLSLAPELLVGWPNPFRDQINIRFIVPQTMKEAFVWADKDNQPTEIELEGDVPWSGGRPAVSVKIYNVNGQELVTLHSASEGTGEYSVHWNGTDAYGRKVASGPYFCKLQMDDWSVTRQIVFLR